MTRAPAIVQTSMIHVDEKQDRSAGSDGRLRLRKRGDLPCLTERVPSGGVRQLLWRQPSPAPTNHAIADRRSERRLESDRGAGPPRGPARPRSMACHSCWCKRRVRAAIFLRLHRQKLILSRVRWKYWIAHLCIRIPQLSVDPPDYPFRFPPGTAFRGVCNRS